MLISGFILIGFLIVGVLLDGTQQPSTGRTSILIYNIESNQQLILITVILIAFSLFTPFVGICCHILQA